MPTKSPIKKQTIQSYATGRLWTVPDTVCALEAERATVAVPPWRAGATTLWFLSQFVSLPAVIGDALAMEIPPLPLIPRSAAVWRLEVAAAPPRTSDGRFVVDPAAMSGLVDWAITTDFGPEYGDAIRDEAWHE